MSSPARRLSPPRFLPIAATAATPRAPLKASESVARRIVGHIVDHGLSEGDRLPPEAAMMADYRVSRETLREGLRLLEVQGVITLRRGPGGGPIVRRVDPASLGRTATLYHHLAGATYAELLEAWIVSEGVIAERAAANPDRAAVRDRLTPYLGSRSRAAASDSTNDGGDHDFHSILASLTGNKVLEIQLMMIGRTIDVHLGAAAGHADDQDDHGAIAQAVCAGQRKIARERAEAHVRRIVERALSAADPPDDEVVEWR